MSEDRRQDDGRGLRGLERRKAIIAADRAGRTPKDIAREHGITRERVRQILAKYGAPAGE